MSRSKSRKQGRKQNQCVKCGRTGSLSCHHVFPVVHYGRENNRVVVYLCRTPCHDEMEELITSKEGTRDGCRRRRSKQFYMDCLMEYIQI
jgi:hypothetical protein